MLYNSLLRLCRRCLSSTPRSLRAPLALLVLSGVLAIQPASAAVTYVVLKADDMVAYGGADAAHPAYLSGGWKNFLQMLKDKNINANLGIIGASCNRANDTAFWKELKDLRTAGRVDLFNHGYTHGSGGYPAHNPNTAAWQKADLVQNQNLVRSKIGVVMNACGLPANAANADTVIALNGIPEIRTMLFTPQGTNKRILNRNGEIESTPGNVKPSADFIQSYPGYIATANAAGRTYLCLQVHPHLHNAEDQARLANIIQYVKDRGLIFRTLANFP